MFELLRAYHYYGATENIEIAKGKYELPLKVSRAREQRKRKKLWQTKNG